MIKPVNGSRETERWGRRLALCSNIYFTITIIIIISIITIALIIGLIINITIVITVTRLKKTMFGTAIEYLFHHYIIIIISIITIALIIDLIINITIVIIVTRPKKTMFGTAYEYLFHHSWSHTATFGFSTVRGLVTFLELAFLFAEPFSYNSAPSSSPSLVTLAICGAIHCWCLRDRPHVVNLWTAFKYGH